MARLFAAAAIAALASLPTAFADGTPKCSAGNLCPTDTPCCSQYGECGVGAYCLGGCDPRYSNALDSCVPEPVCQNRNIQMTSLDDIVAKKDYLGDPSKADWVSDGNPLVYNNQVLLTMPADSAGTVLASTYSVWYGKISAKMKTSRGVGVVTAFILLGDSKDEIDYEWIGADLQVAQTNWYSQGVTNYLNSANISLSDTFNNYHTYTIDWTPDQIQWSVDGQVGRTVKRSDTWNSTANRYDFPQTPCRVQLSIWPGGAPSNAPGTIQWAGGPIDWNSQDIQAHGYDYAIVSEVDVQCYQPPNGAHVTGNQSYIYDNLACTNQSIEVSDKPTILKSLLGTGTNMSADYPSDPAAKASQSATVPGLTGAGPGTDGTRGDAGQGQGGGSGGGSGGSSAGAGGGASASLNSAASTQTSFSQGVAKGGASGRTDKVLQGSMFAGLMAIIGLCLL